MGSLDVHSEWLFIGCERKLSVDSKSSPRDAAHNSVKELVSECDVEDNRSGEACRGSPGRVLPGIVGEEFLCPDSFRFVMFSSLVSLQWLQFFDGRDFLRFLDKLRLSFNRKLPLRLKDCVLADEQPKGEHESDLVASKAEGLLVDWGRIPRRGEIWSEEEEEEEWWLREATS